MTPALAMTSKTQQPSAVSESSCQYVVFSLSDQRYAIEIMTVREIRMVRAITTLPGAREFVRGIINLRGTIVPVFDLRMRFGLGMTAIAGGAPLTLVIADVGGTVTGLLVDEVLDILTISSNSVSPVPWTDSSRRNPFFKGLISGEESMIVVIDIDQFVPTEAAGGDDWEQIPVPAMAP